MTAAADVGPALGSRDACKRQTTTCERGPIQHPCTSQGPSLAWQRFHHTISDVIKQHDFTACLYSIEESACNTIIMQRVFFNDNNNIPLKIHWTFLTCPDIFFKPWTGISGFRSTNVFLSLWHVVEILLI